MQGTLLTQVALPLALALIMFGMGLTLRGRDFRILWQQPKPVIVGLTGQLLGLPLLAWLVIWLFDLPAPLAVGLMLVALCPGGTTSNLLCHLARANLALSISLTAISNAVCVVTAPILIALTVDWFATEPTQSFSLLSTALGLFAITLVPIAVGMWVRRNWSRWAQAAERYFRMLSIVVLLCLVVAITIQEWQLLTSLLDQLLMACLAFNLLAVSIGVTLSRLSSLNEADGTTVAIEVGLQNTTLAMMIAITFLQHPDYALTAGLYGLVMYLGAALLLMRKRIGRASFKQHLNQLNQDR